jgi:hypothetical protein
MERWVLRPSRRRQWQLLELFVSRGDLEDDDDDGSSKDGRKTHTGNVNDLNKIGGGSLAKRDGYRL